MKNRLLLLFVTLLGLCFTSCSDNDIMAPASDQSVDRSAITFYFPVDPGYTSRYEVRDSDGRITSTTFRVGENVPFSQATATLWFYETASGYDTSYIVVNGSSLYLYEGVNSAGERILQGPINPGAKWTRYPSNDVTDTVSIVTGETDLGDILTEDDGGNGGAATKVFPITGSNELRVAAVETIVLSNGDTYAGSARIVNELSDGSTNQYWFAPGYGLVRYVIGSTATYPNGRQYGELVSFSR